MQVDDADLADRIVAALGALDREREEIRGRVEKMLQRIDTLTEEQAAS